MSVFSYVVAGDSGFAPNPFHGFCTLACCKPSIRRTAAVGDLIVGLSRLSEQVVYATRVTEVLGFDAYWRDPRFEEKRPDLGGSDPARRVGDNVYEPDGGGGFVQHDSMHSVLDEQGRAIGEHPGHLAHDLGGRNVLVSDDYAYFGGDGPQLPEELAFLATGRGHRSRFDEGQIRAVERWFERQERGVLGRPKQWSDDGGRDDSSEAERERGRAVSARPSASGCLAPSSSSPSPSRSSRTRQAAQPGPSPCVAPARAPLDREPTAPRRLILSRKGFDSGAGGGPSPILPDGRLVSLPIPDSRCGPRYDSVATGSELGGTETMGALLASLRRYDAGPEHTAHLDPDLVHGALPRRPGWRPAFGQVGGSATTLAKHGVGVGDLFLFFGWFRSTEVAPGGGLRFSRGAPDVHVLFGWLQIGQVLHPRGPGDAPAWASDHPHVLETNRTNNTLFVASEELVVDGQSLGVPGGGVFERFRPELQLTEPGRSRSIWLLPRCFAPRPDRGPLSSHARADRWSDAGDHVRLASVARGQEFVLDRRADDESRVWLRDLLAPNSAR